MARKKDPDFLLWDKDIDLDNLLGEYTDDEPNSEVKSKVSEKCVYVCPECKQEYKSVSGFRGHVSKKHQKNLKAHEHRKGTTKSTAPPLVEHVQAVFSTAYNRTLENISTDPMHNLFGESTESKVAKINRENTDLKDGVYSIINNIFQDNNAASCMEREQIFQRLHIVRTNEESVKAISSKILVGALEVMNDNSITSFVQILLLEIIGEIFKCLVDHEKQASSVKSETITTNDNQVLYYISGYIIKALERKYHKIKVKGTRDTKLSIISSLQSNNTEKTFTEEYSRMIELKNRGGLKTPTDNFFFLVREFENIVRSHVDMDKLHGKVLQKDKLKEQIMDSFMVKHYSKDLFSDIDSGICESYVEDCVDLFLTVRGHALAKLVKKRVLKELKVEKNSKTSHSLRDSLKNHIR